MLRRCYTLLLYVALPFVSLQVLWRGLSERGYWRGWRERFGYGYSRTDPSVWIHAVSVGEVQAATLLVGALRRTLPQQSLLLTSATPAGRARARDALTDGTEVRYAPYDLPAAIDRVLVQTRPRLLIVLETELWPNLLHACARCSIPVLIVSARISERTQRSYLRLRGLLTASALQNSWVMAQSTADAARFAALGIPQSQVSVAGNVKFDREVDAGQLERGAAMRKRYAGRRHIWVAGSTHPGEELAALQAHRQLCQVAPALLVLAPRHSRRFGDVADVLQLQGWRWQRRSAAPAQADSVEDCEVLLLDTIGELVDFYAAADLAFVGGSLVAVGGHNLLEPVALGVATLTGPQQFNAPDVARILTAHGAVRLVHDAGELTRQVLALMADAAARAQLAEAGLAAMQVNRGALARILEAATSLLAGRGAVTARRPAAPLPAAQ